MLDLWIEHGVRELPTAVYPQSLEDPDGSKVDGAPVTLTTTKHQEVFTFLRPNFDGLDANARQIINRRTHPDLDLTVENSHPFYTAVPPIAFKNLPHLRPGALYIFGGQSELSPPNWRKERMECTGIGVGGSGGLPAGKVSEVLFEDLGHLIPMVAVERCALAAAQWLMSELERWRREEQEWKREWNAKDGRERFTISEEWKNRIGGDPRRKNEKL